MDCRDACGGRRCHDGPAGARRSVGHSVRRSEGEAPSGKPRARGREPAPKDNPPPGVPPVFLSMVTYTGTGQAMEANNTSQDRSVGLGDWARTGHRTFVRTFTYFVFGPRHVFASFTQVTSTIELAPDGETYTATNEFRIYSPGGVLLISGQTTAVANRCGVGDTVPSCIPA